MEPKPKTSNAGTVLFMLIGIVSLTACGPTGVQIQQTIQVGMAQTGVARPTATFTVIPPTATRTITPTVTQTNTPLPTITEIPTQTPVQKVSLHKLLITITDFANMSDFYHPNPLVDEKLDVCSEVFTGSTSTTGNVTITLFRFESLEEAKEINEGLKAILDHIFNVSFTVSVPDNFWVGGDPWGGTVAAATYKNITIQVAINKTEGVTQEDLAPFALLLIKNQVIRLQDGDY